MGLHVIIQDTRNGRTLFDPTPYLSGLSISTGKHGFASCSFFVPRSLIDSFFVYDRPGLPWTIVSWNAITAWEGRLEDVAIVDGGLRLTALGGWRALSDTPYSTSGTPADPAATVRDVIADLAAANSAQLSTNTALVSNTGLDLPLETFAYADAAAAVDRLAGLGDTSARTLEAGVLENQTLFFRPRSGSVKTWYVDVTSLQLERTIDDLYNSVYAVYNSGASVTATSTNAFSVARYGITRAAAIDANTTDATQAGYLRDAYLADKKTPAPRAGITFRELFDASGGRWPLWVVRSGDTIIMRNLSPVLSVDIDKIRSFRVRETTYDADSDVLSVTPESNLPTLDFQVARLDAGISAL